MDTLWEIRNHIAFITLNRPAALNALSLGMIGELRGLLRAFATDSQVNAVLIQGAGEKAFCAGGDIRAIYDSYQDQNSSQLYFDFFAAEYPLDYQLRFFPKPYIALINGIVMGGGMGVAQGSTLRIVGDRTRMAMPEVGIGFFPDVGASYFLSRLPGKLGLYLALTGTQIRAADTLYVGLADYYLAQPSLVSLDAGLAALAWSGADSASCAADISALIRGLSGSPGEAPLTKLRSVIDEHFSAGSVPALLASLARESRAEYKGWAEQTLKLLASRSPTMLAVAQRQLERGRNLSFADCLRMEIGMARQCFDQGDFIEGVRALVIDKDNAPRWRPDRIEDVTDAAVDFIFKNPWDDRSHPLSNLEGELSHAAQ
jgi:enoyl-CoA hydratase/carnithine racemase